MEILDKLQSVIAIYFNVNKSKINPQTTAKDVTGWDSFSHMDLMSTIENEFNITIPFAELMEFSCVNDINKYILKHKG